MAQSSKRPRTEENESGHTISSSVDEMTRHSSLWFDDGSVILVCQNVGFRVHRSTLSSHSSVFADMFRVPQPIEDTSIEGCPVVRIPDGADEISCLLNALYQPLCVVVSPSYTFINILMIMYSYFDAMPGEDTRQAFQNMLSVLRLSTKYDMPTFRSKSMDVMRRTFPTTLAAKGDCTSYRNNRFTVSTSMLIRAILIAQEARVFDILPGIFYVLSHNPISDILDIVDLPNSIVREPSLRAARTCLLGRDKALRGQQNYTLSFLYKANVSEGCTQPHQCKEKFSAILVKWTSTGANLNLNSFTNLGPSMAGWKFCSACYSFMSESHAVGRQKCWELLPSWYGLGTWEEIRAAQDANP